MTMYLHDAIIEILHSENNRGLIAQEIADLNAEMDLYRRKKDGKFPEEWQIRARVHLEKYLPLFKFVPEISSGKFPTAETKIFAQENPKS